MPPIDSGRFDVMMLAYHHGIWSNLAPIIERAAPSRTWAWSP